MFTLGPNTRAVGRSAVAIRAAGKRSLGVASALLLSAVAIASPAYALERVTLRNGFAYDCLRHEPLDSLHIRLFLSLSPSLSQPDAAANSSSGNKAEANYIDVPTVSVAGVEELPNALPLADTFPVGDKASTPDLRALLRGAGTAHNVDEDLLASIVHAESGGRVHALSRSGAIGLMQLMPATALSLGILDARLPEGNINGGTAYLDALLTRYRNNLALALAAYNAGPGAVDRYHGIPPFRETRAYVVRVMTEYKRRKLDLARNELARTESARNQLARNQLARNEHPR